MTKKRSLAPQASASANSATPTLLSRYRVCNEEDNTPSPIIRASPFFKKVLRKGLQKTSLQEVPAKIPLDAGERRGLAVRNPPFPAGDLGLDELYGTKIDEPVRQDIRHLHAIRCDLGIRRMHQGDHRHRSDARTRASLARSVRSVASRSSAMVVRAAVSASSSYPAHEPRSDVVPSNWDTTVSIVAAAGSNVTRQHAQSPLSSFRRGLPLPAQRSSPSAPSRTNRSRFGRRCAPARPPSRYVRVKSRFSGSAVISGASFDSSADPWSAGPRPPAPARSAPL